MITVSILASAAVAAAPPAAAIPRMDYFCSAPLSHSSQLRIHRGGDFYRITGSLQPVDLEPVLDDSKPIPVEGNNIPSTYRAASVEIWDDESHAHVGIHLIPHNRQPDGPTTISDLRVRTWIDADNREYEMGVNSSTDYTDAVPFEIVLDGDEVDIRFGERRQKLKVPFGPKTVVELTCVGGQFWMEDVKIGGH
jgi:hypothetical protein